MSNESRMEDLEILEDKMRERFDIIVGTFYKSARIQAYSQDLADDVAQDLNNFVENSLTYENFTSIGRRDEIEELVFIGYSHPVATKLRESILKSGEVAEEFLAAEEFLLEQGMLEKDEYGKEGSNLVSYLVHHYDSGDYEFLAEALEDNAITQMKYEEEFRFSKGYLY